MRFVALVLLVGGLGLTLGSCAPDASSGKYCRDDLECGEGEVCGTPDCSGLLQCIRAACACQPDGFRNPCSLPDDGPKCSCKAATCEKPLNSCGTSVCPGVCELGESCEFCFEGEGCGLVEPCLGGWCMAYRDDTAFCRPDECLFPKPPLCGTPGAPCGATCPEPDCSGLECGEDPWLGMSCGTCGPHRYCSANICQQSPGYQLCEGDLQATPPEVVVESAPGTIPAAEGGSLADGTYDLVAQRRYAGPGISEIYERAALTVSGGGTRVEHIYDAPLDSFADDETPHRHMNVNASGTTLTFQVTCPDPRNVFFPEYTREFTARDHELWLFQPQFVEVYAKRPD